MNAASDGEPRSRDVYLEATFDWLLPWMTQLGTFEAGPLRAGLSGSGAAAAALPAPEVTLAALQVSEGLVRQFFEASPISVAVFEPVGRLVQVNPAFCAMLGYAAEDLRERNIEDLIHPEDLPSVQERRRMLIEGACNRFEVDTRFAPANRPQVWTRMSGRLERYGGRRPPHIFAHIVEFTEPRHVQENLQRAAEEMVLKNWDPERYL